MHPWALPALSGPWASQLYQERIRFSNCPFSSDLGASRNVFPGWGKCSLSPIPQLTQPCGMSGCLPCSTMTSGPMAPVGGKARVGRGQDGCRESRRSGGCISWIDLNPKMGVFWSEIQLATWSTCEVVGNEAGGALRGLRAQLRSPAFLPQTLGSHGRLLSKGVRVR